MKKKTLITLGVLLLTATALHAQTEITAYDEKTGEDEVIDLPENMDYNLDALLDEWNARKYLSTGDCNMTDESPQYSKEEYMSRLKRMPTVIEMPYNDVVQKFIDQYSGRLRRSVSYMLGASNLYVPIFEEALESYNLPLELKYLPVIESALNPKAGSRAGAVGLWQFMIGTGKRYGLEVNSLVDDRCDPYKASYAAAHYLKDLYDIYGDWNLVIAAYNCGPGNISKAIHRADGARDYWVIYPYLPKETRGYVPAFIAANYIMNYYAAHNICPMTTKLPASIDTIEVNRNVHFQQIAEVCKIDLDEVRALNPQYRTGVIPGASRPSVICLPQNAISTFLDAKDSVYNYKAGQLLTKRDVVEVQEPESQIQERSNSRVRTSEARRSRQKNTASARRQKRGRADRSSRGHSVTVRGGQTLSEIAKRNGTTVKKLKALNGLRGNTIQKGKKLRVK